MGDNMKMVGAIGLAAMEAMLIGTPFPIQNEQYGESLAHKKLRAERRAKRQMQRKSRKANRS